MESFLNGLLYKIELFTNYIIENEFYLNDKTGILFCISHELSLFDEIYQKNDNAKKIAENPEHKKGDEMKKKYDLLVVNNAKDILILNRIIFK